MAAGECRMRMTGVTGENEDGGGRGRRGASERTKRRRRLHAIDGVMMA